MAQCLLLVVINVFLFVVNSLTICGRTPTVWYTGESYYAADAIDDWGDRSGNAGDHTIRGLNLTQHQDSEINGQYYMKGTTSDNFAIGPNITYSDYTIFHVARFDNTAPATYRRIVTIPDDGTGPNGNWASGFHGNCMKCAFHNKWITPSPTPVSLDWVVSTDTLNIYRANGLQQSNQDGNAQPMGQIYINGYEPSSFAIAEIIIFNDYTADESYMNCVENILLTKYGITRDTVSPTPSPSLSPTDITDTPTNNPTLPTNNPTSSTSSPSKYPTVPPTKYPTDSPTTNPTSNPSTSPSKYPTDSPTKNPTSNPSVSPSKYPTSSTGIPTESPTNDPTEHSGGVDETEADDNPGSTSFEKNNEFSDSDNNSSVGAIIGAVVGVILCGIVLFIVIRLKKSRGPDKKHGDNAKHIADDIEQEIMQQEIKDFKEGIEMITANDDGNNSTKKGDDDTGSNELEYNETNQLNTSSDNDNNDDHMADEIDREYVTTGGNDVAIGVNESDEFVLAEDDDTPTNFDDDDDIPIQHRNLIKQKTNANVEGDDIDDVHPTPRHPHNNYNDNIPVNNDINNNLDVTPMGNNNNDHDDIDIDNIELMHGDDNDDDGDVDIDNIDIMQGINDSHTTLG